MKVQKKHVIELAKSESSVRKKLLEAQSKYEAAKKKESEAKRHVCTTIHKLLRACTKVDI